MARLIQGIIQEKRRRLLDGGGGPPPAPRDAIDVLISGGGCGGADELTDELISDNMIDLMIPAEDSVPVLITLAIKYLSECPLALQQLEVSGGASETLLRLRAQPISALTSALHFPFFLVVFTRNFQMDSN
jgi:cytochrome P450